MSGRSNWIHIPLMYSWLLYNNGMPDNFINKYPNIYTYIHTYLINAREYIYNTRYIGMGR